MGSSRVSLVILFSVPIQVLEVELIIIRHEILRLL